MEFGLLNKELKEILKNGFQLKLCYHVKTNQNGLEKVIICTLH